MELGIEKALLGLALIGSTWVIWLLLGLSILALGVASNRLYVFRRLSPLGEKFIIELKTRLLHGDIKGLAHFLANEKSLAADIVGEGLPLMAENRVESAAEAMTGRLIFEKMELERYLNYLGTLGNNAPFIGLLGTVLGIIQAFYDLSLNPNMGSAVVMAGISEALVATALGLLIAIPSVIAFNYFNNRLKRITADCNAAASVLLAFYRNEEDEK